VMIEGDGPIRFFGNQHQKLRSLHFRHVHRSCPAAAKQWN
jgi:hypothetical protein